METVKMKRPARLGNVLIPVGTEIGLPDALAKLAVEQSMAEKPKKPKKETPASL